MPWINLIEDQKLAEKANDRKARTFLTALTGSFCVSLMGFGFLLYQTESAGSEESKLRAKAQRVAPLTAHLNETLQAKSLVGPRLKTLEDAQKSSARWSRILNHLTKHTPPQTWLTALRCTNSDPTKPINVNFVGTSDSQQLIGEFILRLQASSDLEDVNLKFTQEKVVSSGRSIEFEVQAGLEGTAEKKPEIKKEEKS